MAIFAKTAELGSFRGAARQLGLSPSVVSHHVALLERQLSTALLHRSTRRVTLTEAGQRLFLAARTMVSAAESGLSDLKDSAGRLSGQLSLAAPAGLLSSPLADGIAAFAKGHPSVELRMHFSDAPVDLVRDGIDVAFRAGTLKDSALKSKRILSFDRALVASPEYVSLRIEPRAPEDLSDWDWIRLQSRPPRATFCSGSLPPRVVDYRSRIVVDAAEAMLQLSIRGLGLATVPCWMAHPHLVAGALVEVLPKWRLESPMIYALWPATAPRRSLGQRLIEFLAEHVAMKPPRR